MKIEFLPSDDTVEKFVSAPLSSKNQIPQWYKNVPSFFSDLKKTFDSRGQLMNTNVKMCMPFFDALTNGYTQYTWCDIYVEKTNESVNYHWSIDPQIMGHRDSVHIPLNNNFYNLEFFWRIPWIPKTPKGYSILLTHPCNRFDLPFVTASGIIDSDDFHHIKFGQCPFYINKDFEGLIPAGTPMYQVIPIKREDWSSKNLKYNHYDQEKKSFSILKKYWGVYRDQFWKKKNYE